MTFSRILLLAILAQLGVACATSADDVADLVQKTADPDFSKTSGETRERAMERLTALPPKQSVPAVLDAIETRLDQPEHLRPTHRMLVKVLGEVSRRSEDNEFDQALVDYWPRAKQEPTRRVLLILYGLHRVSAAQLILQEVLIDRNAPADHRNYAANALVWINPDRYREQILWELDSQPDWADTTMAELLVADLSAVQAGAAPDGLLITVAMRRIARMASDSNRLSRAAALAFFLEAYTKEQIGVGGLTEHGLREPPYDFARQAENNRAAVKLTLDWWEKNQHRFQPEYVRRKAATQPATRPEDAK